MPISEHVSRLIAARMQWDIMGLETLAIARTDAESAKLISSTADTRDHEFVLGVETEGREGLRPLAEEIARAERDGKLGAEIDELEKAWTSSVKLVTFDEGAFATARARADQCSRRERDQPQRRQRQSGRASTIQVSRPRQGRLDRRHAQGCARGRRSRGRLGLGAAADARGLLVRSPPRSRR